MTHGGLLDRGIGAALINALSTTHGLANTSPLHQQSTSAHCCGGARLGWSLETPSPQARRLANRGAHPAPTTTGMFRRQTRGLRRRGGRALDDACRSRSRTSRPRPADLLAAAANKRSEQTAPSFFSRTTGCHSHQTLSTVVSESRWSPAGRKPLSISSSHSWPSRPFSSTAVVRPAAGPALSIGVLRQNRCCWYSGGTCETRASFVKTLPSCEIIGS